MTTHEPVEHFISQNVTYILEMEGRLLMIENVPARVSQETGEQLFAAETVERIQQTAWAAQTPARVLETPVFGFAESTV